MPRVVHVIGNGDSSLLYEAEPRKGLKLGCNRIGFPVPDKFASCIVDYKFMQAMFPLVLFSIFFLIRVRVSREQVKKIRRERNFDIILHLTCLDKLISDVLIYLLPILILGVAIIINKQITITDIFQAVIAFLIMYFWQNMLFKKEG